LFFWLASCCKACSPRDGSDAALHENRRDLVVKEMLASSSEPANAGSEQQQQPATVSETLVMSSKRHSHSIAMGQRTQWGRAVWLPWSPLASQGFNRSQAGVSCRSHRHSLLPGYVAQTRIKAQAKPRPQRNAVLMRWNPLAITKASQTRLNNPICRNCGIFS
jgi:hypothetical protein